MSIANVSVGVKGHVLIEDKSTGEILLDRFNAIHSKNFAAAIAKGLANTQPMLSKIDGVEFGYHRPSVVFMMKFGNGGTSIGSLGEITYQAPNVAGNTADLYNATYSEVIDAAYAGTPDGNSVSYLISEDPDTSSIVICTATIGANEPSGQDLSLNSTSNEATFAFDELGLFTSDGKLLTHIVFSPIPKTAERELVITYTLTVTTL